MNRIFGVLTAVVALGTACSAPEQGVGTAVAGAGAGRPQDTAPAAPLPPDEALLGAWVLVTFQNDRGLEEAVAAEQRYTIEFGADGRIVGQTHCNRYFGAFTHPAPAGLAIGGMGATLAACPPGSRSSEFLAAVGAATRYELAGNDLKLFGGGEVLTFAREGEAIAAAPPDTGP